VHWKAIEGLADYLLNNTANTISCEEAIAVLDKSISDQASPTQMAKLGAPGASSSINAGTALAGTNKAVSKHEDVCPLHLVIKHRSDRPVLA